MKWIKLFENFEEIKEIVLIGGGISSLYAAYLIKKRFPKIKYTIIEKSEHCGGRVVQDEVDGVPVPTGAQFARIGKDKLLEKLLKDLDVELSTYELDIDFTFKKTDVDKLISKLKKSSSKYDRSKFTFSQFATDVLGENDYKKFVDMMGYTDYNHADLVDTLTNYGLEDNLPGYKAANVPWNKIIKKIISEVGEKNIVYNTEIKSIKKQKSKFIINNKWECDGVIVGVTVNQLRKLFNNSIYKQIESQKFLKVFAKTKGMDDVKTYTVMDSPMRKVLPVKDDVFTITFCDNEDADYLKSKNKSYFEKSLSEQLKDEITIQKMKKFFWEEGTHYFKPLQKKWKSRKEFLDEAQHPEKNIWVIGEVVAEKQGWVEGALNSVENISLFKK